MTESVYHRALDYMSYLNECARGKMDSRKKQPLWIMEKFTAHQLRYTCASMLFDAGVDAKYAQKFLGHTDIEVTLSIYTQVTQFPEEEIIDALNEHLNSANA